MPGPGSLSKTPFSLTTAEMRLLAFAYAYVDEDGKHDYNKIAEIANIGVNSVRSGLRKAKAKILKALGDYQPSKPGPKPKRRPVSDDDNTSQALVPCDDSEEVQA
ncbi:hypothetical protein N7507_010541 [Penicillium longicatenatum]|nr:hypothetical protein N7507_010541 [Penicillium longicatenatum]